MKLFTKILFDLFSHFQLCFCLGFFNISLFIKSYFYIMVQLAYFIQLSAFSWIIFKFYLSCTIIFKVIFLNFTSEVLSTSLWSWLTSMELVIVVRETYLFLFHGTHNFALWSTLSGLDHRWIFVVVVALLIQVVPFLSVELFVVIRGDYVVAELGWFCLVDRYTEHQAQCVILQCWLHIVFCSSHYLVVNPLW